MTTQKNAQKNALYAWARGRGWGGGGEAWTHLLLDGGKLNVPREHAGTFLNAYAAAAVKAPRPCVVEVRTPGFKLFLDLDVCYAAAGAADDESAAARAVDVLRRVADAVFPPPPAADDDDEPPAAIACFTQPKPAPGGAVKRGMHVHFPRVRVVPETAEAFRKLAVAALDAEVPAGEGTPFARPWGAALDAAVYRSSGLRLAWSAKGAGDGRFYYPALAWRGGAWERLDSPAGGGGVSAIRALLPALSIRCFDGAATPSAHPALVAAAAAAAAAGGVARPRVRAVGAPPDSPALRAVHAALPPEFAGAQFTSVIPMSEDCVLLRSTARFCLNLGREHRTNNVYFCVTKHGVAQKCYCRCDTAEGRKHGLCRDFCGPWFPLPAGVAADVLREHGAPAAAPAAPAAEAAAPLTHQRRKLSLSDLLDRPALLEKRRKR